MGGEELKTLLSETFCFAENHYLCVVILLKIFSLHMNGRQTNFLKDALQQRQHKCFFSTADLASLMYE